MKGICNNHVQLYGKVENPLSYSHTIKGINFFIGTLKVKRLSGKYDYIPILAADLYRNVISKNNHQSLCISGEFRSYNANSNNSVKLLLYVLVQEVEITSSDLTNYIELTGYICKLPRYRKTPLGRKITDTIIAVNRCNRKSDYFPCVFWESNALYASRLRVGNEVSLTGRIESREYEKKIKDSVEIRIAIEVSVKEITSKPL